MFGFLVFLLFLFSTQNQVLRIIIVIDCVMYHVKKIFSQDSYDIKKLRKVFLKIFDFCSNLELKRERPC